MKYPAPATLTFQGLFEERKLVLASKLKYEPHKIPVRFRAQSFAFWHFCLSSSCSFVFAFGPLSLTPYLVGLCGGVDSVGASLIGSIGEQGGDDVYWQRDNAGVSESLS